MPEDPTLIVAHGDIDADTLGTLGNALGAAASSQQTVIFDAGDVTFADSSLLNLLLRTHQATTLLIAAPSLPVRRLLEITGTDQILHLYPTTAAARATLPSSGLPLPQ